MGNKRLIFAIIIVIALIAGLVGGYLYLQNNSKQANVLQEEMTATLEKDLINDNIDIKIKSTGNYGIVEKTIKEYLNNVKSIYTQAQNFCSDSEVTKILSAENLEADSKELTVVSQKVDEYKAKLETLKTNTKNITNSVLILEAIQNTGVKQNYIDVYNNIMENEGVQAKLSNVQEKIEAELEEAQKRVIGLEKVVLYLKNNSKYWEVNDGKLQFTNVNKLAEYYQLLNGDK